jgi:hypothetical protein
MRLCEHCKRYIHTMENICPFCATANRSTRATERRVSRVLGGAAAIMGLACDAPAAIYGGPPATGTESRTADTGTMAKALPQEPTGAVDAAGPALADASSVDGLLSDASSANTRGPSDASSAAPHPSNRGRMVPMYGAPPKH